MGLCEQLVSWRAVSSSDSQGPFLSQWSDPCPHWSRGIILGVYANGVLGQMQAQNRSCHNHSQGRQQYSNLICD